MTDDEDVIFVSPPVKRKAEEPEGESMGTDCIICFETCTSSGPHQVCALRCGHLFGKSCIRTWINQGKKQESKAACPQCKKPATTKDILPIFATQILVESFDHRSEILQLQDQVEKLKNENERLKYLSNEKKVLCDLYQSQYETARQELSQAKSQIQSLRWSMNIQEPSTPSSSSYQMLSQLMISKETNLNTRAFDISTETQKLMICTESNKEHGVLFIMMMDHSHKSFIPLHSGCIRDIKVGQDIFLTASVDKTMKLSHLKTGNVACTFNCPCPVWSCAFDDSDPNLLHAGLLSSQVQTFDIRQPSEPVATYNISHFGKGIHSLFSNRLGACSDHVFSFQQDLEMIQSGTGCSALSIYEQDYITSWRTNSQVLHKLQDIVFESPKQCNLSKPCLFKWEDEFKFACESELNIDVWNMDGSKTTLYTNQAIMALKVYNDKLYALSSKTLFTFQLPFSSSSSA